MSKALYNPNAYLSRIRNVKRGLKTRTQILGILEKRSVEAVTLSKEGGMAYGVVMHHLRLLEAEGIVARKGKRPLVWTLTGLGQMRLVNTG